ncbi:MAG: hypothetical protein AAF390_08490 [Pseudomonadota bacterium]
MEPVSLSLVAIGASSMALRRATRDDPNMLPFETEGLAAAGAALMGALSGGRFAPRPVARPASRSISLQLARFAAAQDLHLNASLPVGGTDDDPARRVADALRDQRIDFALTDRDGTPVCGIEVVTAARPSRCDDALRATGLPVVTLDADAAWAPNRDRLLETLAP